MNLPNYIVCPSTRKPLRLDEDDRQLRVVGGDDRSYSVVDGVPVLLARAREREALSDDIASHCVDFRQAFYNQRTDERYLSCQPKHQELIRKIVEEHRIKGPSLEIGSGRGHLQDLAPEYVAIDYSFENLRQFISRDYTRICASAERLPIASDSMELVYPAVYVRT